MKSGHKTAIKMIVAVLAVLIIVGEFLLILNFAPKRPFSGIETEDISAVYVLYGELEPYRLPEEDIENFLLSKLEAITFYGRAAELEPDEITYGAPRLARFRIELKNGKTYEIGGTYPHASLNGKLYYTDYYPWLALKGKYDDWVSLMREASAP